MPTIRITATTKQGRKLDVLISVTATTATATLLDQPVTLLWQGRNAFISISQATMKALFGMAVGPAGVLVALDRDPAAEIAALQPPVGKALFGAAYAEYFEKGFFQC